MTQSDFRNEKFRPQYHFTPPAKWINDPNGLVYYDGEYHLFYQYHPDSLVWGPMHWGHAVSTDLVHWEHLPIALYPDELGAIFSGSAVIDWHNTAGFGKEAMIALFTYHLDSAQKNFMENQFEQSQALAYSLDKGRSWVKFADNPILPPVPNKPDFRDPKVFWYTSDAGAGHWVMVLAAGDSAWFYRSDDLKSWTKTSEFGKGFGGGGRGWETPDLFQLPFEDSNETRWVLTAGIMRGAPAGGTGSQYFVGDFDGETFTSDTGPDAALWADFGADFYAAQSWSDEPNKRRVWIGWMNNWAYAREIPTPTWRGAMSVPRVLSLRKSVAGPRLCQTPVAELADLRGKEHRWAKVEIDTAISQIASDVQGECLEILAEFRVDAETAPKFGLRVRQSESEQTTIFYEVASQTLSFDRTQAGVSDFHDGFAGVHIAALAPMDGVIRLHIFVDRSSVEVFVNDGFVTMTERVFPDDKSVEISFFADGGSVFADSIVVYELASIWK